MRNFNPRSYKRSDLIHQTGRTWAKFQSTLLQEERPVFPDVLIWRPEFQSTLLQEERRKDRRLRPHDGNFNPRSYKRSDVDARLGCAISLNFNPRSYKRSDVSQQSKCYFLADFNPRSYKRSDILILPCLPSGTWFQSTLLQEERPHWQCLMIH